MHVRRGTSRLAAALLLTGAALLAGPSALAQEADPCAPAADGSVPEMCQGGEAPEPAPEPAPTDPCPPQPVEPGDGVVTDGGDQGVAVGEPGPAAPVEEGEVEPEPAPEEPTMVAPVPDEPVSDDPAVSGPAPGAVGDDGIICAFGVPVAAPVDAGAPEAAAGGGTAAAAGAGNGAVAAGQLPRTGPKERLAALAAAGLALLLVGAGANAAGRRRPLEA